MLSIPLSFSSNLVFTDCSSLLEVCWSTSTIDKKVTRHSCTDWFFFLVLDIGNPEVSDIPVGTRIAIGLLQAIAVRAAGFATITLAVLAPAVK